MKRYREAVRDSEIEWVTWHDLRHTFASRLAMQAVPLTTIAALLRHSTTSLVKRYAHLSPDYLKDSIEQVSSFGKVETLDTESGPLKVELPGISIPTVTETGNEEMHGVENAV